LYNALQGFWGEAMKSQVFLSGINDSKGHENVKDDERSGHPRSLTELMKILKKCRIWCIQIFNYKPSLLYGTNEVVM
jgi:hypothetical protein